MSKPRLQMTARIDTLAHAITIRNAIRDELIGKDIFEEHSLMGFVDGDGTVVGNLDVRFNSDVDRNSVRDWIEDQIQNHPQIKNWILQAKVWWHRCTHDEIAVNNCGTTEYAKWVK